MPARWIALLIAVVSLSLPIRPASAASVGAIVFTSERERPLQGKIYLMNPDGTDQHRLTQSRETSEYFPTWSPDGTRIAYLAGDPLFGGQIIVVNADGSDARQITSGFRQFYLNLNWSPDGQWIAYGGSEGAGVLGIITPDGSVHRQVLTGLPSREVQPTWSPDSQRIAFSKGEGLYVVNVDGSGEQVLLQSTDVNPFGARTSYVYPAWSPDGAQIAFASNRDSRFLDIYLINADGSNLRQVTDASGDDFAPAWSPDGSQIIFTSQRHDYSDDANHSPLSAIVEHVNNELYSMNVDGSNVRRLTDVINHDQFADWGGASTAAVVPTPIPSSRFTPGDIAYPAATESETVPLFAEPDRNSRQKMLMFYGLYVTVVGNPQMVGMETWWPVAFDDITGWMLEEALLTGPNFAIGEQAGFGEFGGQLRESPSPNADPLPEGGNSGEMVVIIDGPQRDKFNVYWKVRTTNGIEGWTLESSLASPSQNANAAATANAPREQVFLVQPTSAVTPIPTAAITPSSAFTPGTVAYASHSGIVTAFLQPDTASSGAALTAGEFVTITGESTIADGIVWWKAVYAGLDVWVREVDFQAAPAYSIGQQAVTIGQHVPLLRTPDEFAVGGAVSLPPSTGLTIIDGPQYDARWIYWKVRTADGTEGWILEISLSPADRSAAISPQSGSAVLQPTPTANTIPTIQAVQPVATAAPVTCPGSLVSRLRVGEKGRVTPGDANNLREQPSTSAARIGQIPGSGEFLILDGPVCAAGYAWWQVNYNGLIGWTVESGNGEYWLEMRP